MEKISYLPNGQWKLSKMAWGHKDYELTSHGDNPYTEKEKQAHIDSLMNHIAEKGYDTKDVDGVPHILVHRGISDYQGWDEKAEGRPYIDPKSEGPNKINFSKPGTISTTHNSVHTLDRREADEYAMNHGDDSGISHSFWVPLSNVIGHATTINRGEKSYNIDPNHVTISPGNYKTHEARYFEFDSEPKYGTYRTKPIKVDKY